MERFSAEWWSKVNGKPGRRRDERELDRRYGPRYPELACLEKHRKLAREGKDAPGYGAAVHEAIRKLNNPAARRAEVPLHCTVVNTCGTDNTAAGEDERYRMWVDVRLPMIRIARAIHAEYVAGLRAQAEAPAQPRAKAAARRRRAA